MQIEIRSNGIKLSGYANVTEKKSKPVITPRGKVVEEIEPKVFERALERAENVTMTKDHDANTLAETRTGSLKLYEDNIGLHYDADIIDERTVEEAKNGKIKGLSFGMYNVKDEIEERAGDLPLRKIKSLDLDHITLVVNKTPCYSATSVEIRADEEIDMETRTIEQPPQITETEPNKPGTPFFDNSAYWARVKAIEK